VVDERISKRIRSSPGGSTTRSVPRSRSPPDRGEHSPNAESLTPEVAASSQAIDVFMSILKRATVSHDARGDERARCSAMIPSWPPLLHGAARLYHVYTVDEHSLIGIAS